MVKYLVRQKKIKKIQKKYILKKIHIKNTVKPFIILKNTAIKVLVMPPSTKL